MTKITGCIMIFSSAFIYMFRQCHTYKNRIALYAACAAALEDISTAIRWQRQPLPDAIAQQCGRAYIGPTFQKMKNAAQPLQVSWNSCFSELDCHLAEILCSISLSGDAEHLLGQFERATHRLDHCVDELRAAEKGRNKLNCAAAMSAAVLLAVLLL